MLMRAFISILALTLFTTAASAVTITTVRVDHVSSELAFNGPFSRAAVHTVNGNGLNINGPNTHSNAPDGTMWLSTTSDGACCGGTLYKGNITAAANPADTSPEITFDLGGQYNVSTMKVWNYNEAAAGLSTRGVRTANVRVSNDGINYTSLGVVALNQAGGLNNNDFSQTVALNVNTRFVKLDNLTNHGAGSGFTGLSEVRFDGTEASATQELVAGVIATASSELGGAFNRTASHVVDGSGLTLANGTHTNVANGNMWLSTGNGVAGGTPDSDPQITFDLGQLREIREIQIWNYNEVTSGGNPFRNRGVNDMTVLVSDDGISFTSLGSTQLFAGTGTSDRDFHQTLDLNGVKARFIRFDDLTSHGGDNGFVGLSEVRIFATPIPEPASAMLALAGLSAMGLRRRRMLTA